MKQAPVVGTFIFLLMLLLVLFRQKSTFQRTDIFSKWGEGNT